MVKRPTNFTTEYEKSHVIDILREYISISESFHYGADKIRFNNWKKELMNIIKENFTSNEVADFFDAESQVVLTRSFFAGMTEEDSIISYELATARKALRFILKNVGEGEEILTSNVEMKNVEPVGKNVFIVHGHDNAARESVARTVAKLGLTPIILHEQPNRGATIIEKFERHADVGFAIILLTPDDEGRTKGDKKLSERSRQNVILELGYFIGKLGREHVMVLRNGDIEIPSDVFGVVYEPLDGGGAWQFKLGKELQAAGYDVDLNKL